MDVEMKYKNLTMSRQTGTTFTKGNSKSDRADMKEANPSLQNEFKTETEKKSITCMQKQVQL